MNGWMEGWTCVCVHYIQMNERMNGWIDGWMNGCVYVSLFSLPKKIYSSISELL